jgi:hypothetical protein
MIKQAKDSRSREAILCINEQDVLLRLKYSIIGVNSSVHVFNGMHRAF